MKPNYYRRLRDLREDHDMTQQQVADYLGIKQPQYFRYESGMRAIHPEALKKLAKLYNTSVDYILGQTDEKKPYKPKD